MIAIVIHSWHCSARTSHVTTFPQKSKGTIASLQPLLDSTLPVLVVKDLLSSSKKLQKFASAILLVYFQLLAIEVNHKYSQLISAKKESFNYHQLFGTFENCISIKFHYLTRNQTWSPEVDHRVPWRPKLGGEEPSENPCSSILSYKESACSQ